MTIRGLAKVKSMHQAGVRTMRLGTRPECVRSSPRVSGVCQDGTREFTGRRPRLTERLSGVAERLARSWEGIEKITRNTPGDRQGKTVRLAIGDFGGYRITGVRS
ncbi:hypothetical protein B296_00024283 [Ensete ventricosum]|uniref:Uncharacterized protein n=1 Tax=Ensete ventricosum TaxID=4639 RepID=A0A426Y5P9_ENSVE|nr:hypothetical protein B296_00024283 [Ensete ventricosum]